MVTLSGAWLNPRSFTMSAEDGGRHLGRILRFGGTLGTADDVWWTVLQHSLLVARLARWASKGPRVELGCLWHDRAEVITGDWVRPWKLPEVKRAQDMLDTISGASLGLPTFTTEEKAQIKALDDEACVIEAHIMAPLVARRHPDTFGTATHADQRRRDGLFDGLWTGHFMTDVYSTWRADGALVQLFVSEHERLMHACGLEIRAPLPISMDGEAPPHNDGEAR